MPYDIMGDELSVGEFWAKDIVGDNIYAGDFSGYDGVAGYDAVSGYDGIAGYDAVSGYDPIAGYDAMAGYDGYAGYDAVSGYDAYVGYEPVAYAGASPELAQLMAIAGAAPMAARRRPMPAAVRPPMPQAPRVPPQAAMRRPAPAQPRPNPNFRPHVVKVVDRPSVRRREFPIGFTSEGNVQPGAIANIRQQPQVPFRGERLIVPSDIAGSFHLVDLKIGKNSQLVSPGNIPARGFSETAVGVRLLMDTAQVSQIITLSVQNVSGAALPFSALMVGVAVE